MIPTMFVAHARRFRLLAMLAALPFGLWLAGQLGVVTERWLFYGDIKAWLDGQIGSGVGGWMFVMLPLSALFVAWMTASYVTPLVRHRAGHLSRTSYAFLDLAKFLVVCVTVIGVAYLAAYVVNFLAWDPRGKAPEGETQSLFYNLRHWIWGGGAFIDTYVQRNAMVVGFTMGFAIIPIIYTIADDALSAVPESLRAGSLGAGATQWQTALRIVIPVAMSGLFSALMIGLGRAVGETMIVLMAAGNTPVMDLNIFNGFRTLSANIAVELPEAVPGSTHYRLLYLAALTLFVMTFAVNTVAELVRMRFRKRAFQL